MHFSQKLYACSNVFAVEKSNHLKRYLYSGVYASKNNICEFSINVIKMTKMWKIYHCYGGWIMFICECEGL